MNAPRLKIFVSAYACEPGLGSEIGVGWHWVLEMAQYFDLWVLTRESNRAGIERWLGENPMEYAPHFVYFDLPPRWRFWKRGLRGVRTYYVLWQFLTNKLVKKTMLEHDIKIYHLLTYGNALWPASTFGMKQFFIWGPMAVGSYVSSDFTRHYGFKNRMKEFAQRLMARSLPCNWGFRARCAAARLMFCKTEQTRISIPLPHRDRACVFTDVAIDLFDTSAYASRVPDGQTHFLAVGRLESWRGFDLLIEAFAVAFAQDSSLRLDILGKGSDEARLRALIDRHAVADQLRLRGQVSMEEYYAAMARCDVVVNPTLKEGAVTTAFDSMSFAKPLLCVDSGGYTRYFKDDYSCVLPLRSRALLIEDLAAAMLRLRDVSVREQMAQRIRDVRSSFVWACKGRAIRDAIVQAWEDGRI